MSADDDAPHHQQAPDDLVQHPHLPDTAGLHFTLPLQAYKFELIDNRNISDLWLEIQIIFEICLKIMLTRTLKENTPQKNAPDCCENPWRSLDPDFEPKNYAE